MRGNQKEDTTKVCGKCEYCDNIDGKSSCNGYCKIYHIQVDEESYACNKFCRR